MMNFGQAVESLKARNKVARAGWNGKNMHLFLVPGDANIGAMGNPATVSGVPVALFSNNPEAQCTRLPHINMRAAGLQMVPSW